MKKARQNAKRRAPSIQPEPEPQEDRPSPAILEHVRTVVSMIEGRAVTVEEIEQMLREKMRQHSMVQQGKIEQSVAWLNEAPP